MGLFGKSKKELLQWQQLVVENSPDKLVISEKELQRLSQIKAQNSLGIVKDSAKILCKTTDPEVFFSRYELLLNHSYYLVQLSKYVKFSGASPNALFQQTQAQKQTEIRNLISRCWDNAISKAEKLKTPSAKSNRYIKLRDALDKFSSEMSEENKAYNSIRYNSAIGGLPSDNG